jgi:predicted nucleic acid-binding protein
MTDTILDTDVLVSIFLGLRDDLINLLRLAADGRFDLILPEYILDEVEGALRASIGPVRRCYDYSEEAIRAYRRELECLNRLTGPPLPPIQRTLGARHSDVIVDLAVAAGIEYIVTQDADLLAYRSIHAYWVDGPVIQIVSPDEFMSSLEGTDYSVKGEGSG